MKWFIVILILSIILISGCSSNKPTPEQVINNSAEVKQFLSMYPNAKVDVVFLENASVDINKLRIDCGEQMIAQNYWKITAVDPETNATLNIWLDYDTQKKLCAFGTPGKSKTQESSGNETIESTDTCDDYCSGSTLNYNGTYIDGNCNYSSVICDYGCVKGKCKQQWVGLEITDFSPNETETYGGTENITMNIINEGGYGVPQFGTLAYLTGSAVSENTQNEMYWNSTDSLEKTTDRYMNTDGEEVFNWMLKSPVLPSGEIRTDVFIGRIYYDYQTIASGNIWIYTEAEAEAASQTGRSLNNMEWSTSQSPISITVNRNDSIILSGGLNSFSLPIKINNVGGGTLYRAGGVDYARKNLTLTSDELNKIDIEVNTQGMIVSNCTGEKELYQGSDIELSCKVTVTNPPAAFQAYPFTITATYGYFTEKTASVTVHGI